jgi:hypothetical protein
MKNPSRNKAAILEFSLAQLVWAGAEGGKGLSELYRSACHGPVGWTDYGQLEE